MNLNIFSVISKTGKFYEVYSVKSDKHGYPHFLIYDDKQWKWRSAKNFEPVELGRNWNGE